jgi:DsbC/DsbD-like thiol-disulfide interchange protein
LCIQNRVRRYNRDSGFSRAFTLGVVLLLCAASAPAEGTPIPHGTLELIAENQWIAAGHTLNLGLHFQLEKGWHVYWINPGDSGEPPRVEWRLPTGLTAGPMEWPTPRRIETSSIVDFGYENAVMLIVPIRVDASLATQQPLRLGAALRLLVCSREMCIPGKAQLAITLPVKSQPSASDSRNIDLFTATRRSLPRPAPKDWRLSVTDANDSFVLTANVGHQIARAIFFPLAESQIDNAAPQKFLPAATGFQLTLRKSDRLLKPIDRLMGVLVLSDDRAYLVDLPLSKHSASRSSYGIGIHALQSLKEGS